MDKKNVVPQRLSLGFWQGGWSLLDEEGMEVVRVSGQLIDGSGRRERFPDGVIKTEDAMQAIALKVAARYNDGDLIGRQMTFVPGGVSGVKPQKVTVLEVEDVPVTADTVYCVKFEDGVRGQVCRSELSDVAVGTIHPKTAVFMSQHVGAAGDEFELMTSMNLSPMIQSRVTGKTWSLGWQELVQLAIAAGVNKED